MDLESISSMAGESFYPNVGLETGYSMVADRSHSSVDPEPSYSMEQKSQPGTDLEPDYSVRLGSGLVWIWDTGVPFCCRSRTWLSHRGRDPVPW